MGSVSNPLPQMTYVELDGSATHTQVANAAWEDWDVSASIPQQCKAIEILVPTGAANTGVRRNGSAQNRQRTFSSYSIDVVPDALRIIETYGNTGAVFNLMGYWV